MCLLKHRNKYISIIIIKNILEKRYKSWLAHRRLCRVKNMLAGPKNTTRPDSLLTTPVTSTPIYPVKISIGHKSPTDLRSEMIFLQGKPVFYTFLPSTSPLLTDNLPILLKWTPPWLQKRK